MAPSRGKSESIVTETTLDSYTPDVAAILGLLLIAVGGTALLGWGACLAVGLVLLWLGREAFA